MSRSLAYLVRHILLDLLMQLAMLVRSGSHHEQSHVTPLQELDSSATIVTLSHFLVGFLWKRLDGYSSV